MSSDKMNTKPGDEMDHAILNLMFSSLDGSSEESASETNSVIEGFDFLNTPCEGKCWQKVKSILTQAANAIRMKDRQIDNLILLALNKYPDFKNFHEQPSLKPTKVDAEKNILDFVSKYQDHQKKVNKENENEMSIQHEKEELEVQSTQQAKSIDEQLNALLEESNEKVKSLEMQKQEVENQLAEMQQKQLSEKEQMSAKDILIMDYKKKIMELEDKVKTNDNAVKKHEKEKVQTQLATIIIDSFKYSINLKIENNLAGPGWLVVYCKVLNEPSKTVFVEPRIVFELLKTQRHELYIHGVYANGKFHYAHWDEFSLSWDK
ncbi:myosin-2 heavy chain-like [Drosophila willistoni]|uniref:myosin-2 heavy chain-like n=1 Tax=Drosophila willistoni TaxID=7260 RepID=UPI000C26D042|nr:myosin-2 heavy chain-like [Drosophila willistoni]